jgi:hypothetical protein
MHLMFPDLAVTEQIGSIEEEVFFQTNLSEEGYKVATRANPSQASQRRAFC